MTYGFNCIWAGALNARKKFGATHLVMQHDDVCPEDNFVDILYGELLEKDADVVSAVIPIKDGHGTTTTAMDSGNPWNPRRLTLSEIAPLPQTFNCSHTDWPNATLLINTGLWICDLRKPWCDAPELLEDGAFQFKGRIIKDPTGRTDEYVVDSQSEDWLFSKMLSKLGASVWATQKVKVNHHGDQMFPNHPVWGSWETDRQWIVYKKALDEAAMGIEAA